MYSRMLPPSPHVFADEADVPRLRLGAIEGTAFAGGGQALRVMMVTEEFGMLQIHRPRGSADPKRRDDDHDTVACVASAAAAHRRQELRGAAGPGVDHWTEALEASIQVEVKAPACRTRKRLSPPRPRPAPGPPRRSGHARRRRG